MSRCSGNVKRAGVIGVACVLAVVAVGCGGGASKPPPEQADVSQVVHSYLTAQAQGDGTTGCSMLTPAAQDKLIALVVKEGKGLITSRPSCSSWSRRPDTGASSPEHAPHAQVVRASLV